MHILFIYGGLPLGGIETLLVRLSKGLNAAGVKVSVLLTTRNCDSALLASLSEVARVAYLDQFIGSGTTRTIQRSPLLYLGHPVNAIALEAWLESTPTVCHAPDTNSLVYAARLAASAKLGKLTTGVYHDREFHFDSSYRGGFVGRARSLFGSLPDENIVFFNETSKAIHAARYGRSFAHSPVTPIGVDTARFAASSAGAHSRRIVSIGRLTKFKTYNRETIRAIHRLRQKGIALSYDIYGEGDCMAELQQLCKDLDLAGSVHFKGSIPYDRFEASLQGALAFVGSGTALIEASAAGVPALIGIEDEDSANTYGFLHDLSGLSYHDKALRLPMTTFDERIEWLTELSAQSYQQESERARQRATDFDLGKTIASFHALGRSAQPYAPSIGRLEATALLFSVIKLRLRSSKKSGGFFHRHSAAA